MQTNESDEASMRDAIHCQRLKTDPVYRKNNEIVVCQLMLNDGPLNLKGIKFHPESFRRLLAEGLIEIPKKYEKLFRFLRRQNENKHTV